jgi:hypothetical protein
VAGSDSVLVHAVDDDLERRAVVPGQRAQLRLLRALASAAAATATATKALEVPGPESTTARLVRRVRRLGEAEPPLAAVDVEGLVPALARAAAGRVAVEPVADALAAILPHDDPRPLQALLLGTPAALRAGAVAETGRGGI